MPATNAKFESEWFEGVEILYYASNDNEAQGSFYEDCLLALAHAKSRDDSRSSGMRTVMVTPTQVLSGKSAPHFMLGQQRVQQFWRIPEIRGGKTPSHLRKIDEPEERGLVEQSQRADGSKAKRPRRGNPTPVIHEDKTGVMGNSGGECCALPDVEPGKRQRPKGGSRHDPQPPRWIRDPVADL